MIRDFTPLRETLRPEQLPGIQQIVTVGAHRVHVTDEGPRDGAPVVLIHGFAAWAYGWREQRRALAAAGYRVLAVDLLGYGGTSRPTGPLYATAAQARVVLGALDALGIGAAHVVGHSFGGRVALYLAISAPARVRRLVVICPEAFSTTRPPIALVTGIPLIGHALAFGALAPPFVKLGLRSLTRTHAWLTDEVAAGYAAPLRVQGTADAQVWQARSPKDGGLSVPEHLASVHAPTLIIWGAEDPVFPAAEARRLAAIIPDARARILSTTGHLPHEEHAAVVNADLVAFFGEGAAA